VGPPPPRAAASLSTSGTRCTSGAGVHVHPVPEVAGRARRDAELVEQHAGRAACHRGTPATST